MGKWINYKEQKPPYGVEVLAYHHEWVNEDFNPKGIRVGFLQDSLAEDANDNPCHQPTTLKTSRLGSESSNARRT